MARGLKEEEHPVESAMLDKFEVQSMELVRVPPPLPLSLCVCVCVCVCLPVCV
jgi:hypothetical protein